MTNLRKYISPKKYLDYFSYKLRKKYKVSYSQCGEDLVVRYIFSQLKIRQPTYIDIGTNHPIANNNTYLFYSRGSRGICIEPDPQLYEEIRRTRKRDVCLNIGIGPVASSSVEYYVMSSRSLSTFVKSEATDYVSKKDYGEQKIEKVLHIPLLTLKEVRDTYLPTGVDFVSIDTEGLDLEILKSIDYTSFRPTVICVETARFDAQGVICKQQEILDFMKEKGYSLYADTYINSIFIDTVHLSRIH